MPVEEHLVDRAQLLELSAPEMTVLIGGLRVLQVGDPKLGVLTKQPGQADERLLRQPARHGHEVEGGRRRVTTTCSKAATARPTQVKWTGTRADLIFGSHSQLRALAEVYGANDAKEKFVKDFVAGVDQGDGARSLRPP